MNLIGSWLGDIIRKLFDNVRTEWVPYVALIAFAGLRQAEVLRLRWSDILWEDALIHIRQQVAKRTTRKVGDSRYIPMPANLLAWLRPWTDATGQLYATLRPDNEQREWAKLLPGGKWGKNPLRHSWFSYRAAETGNLPQVTTEAGNSTQTARDHYINPRMKREAVAWFNIFPKDQPANLV